ncbi:MAG: SMC-Scp complex subunit ScpB [Minisyncoccia bacterium]
MAKPTNLTQILEGMLFAYGETINIKKLASVLKRPANEISVALANLRKSLTARGIKLLDKNNCYQLVADKSASDYIEKLVHSEIKEELTPAGLEVLAITAYRGPVAKSEIETLRGVNSVYILRNLTMRGLVEKDETVKPPLFNISLAALRKLGLTAAEELPQYHDLRTETKKIEAMINVS